jgi:hypothetical protein
MADATAARAAEPPLALGDGLVMRRATIDDDLDGGRAFPDCRTRGDEAPVLLEALFPKQLSRVWPIE